MGSTESAPSSEEESRPTSVNSSSFLYREELVRKLQEIAEARQTDHTNPNNYNVSPNNSDIPKSVSIEPSRILTGFEFTWPYLESCSISTGENALKLLLSTL